MSFNWICKFQNFEPMGLAAIGVPTFLVTPAKVPMHPTDTGLRREELELAKCILHVPCRTSRRKTLAIQFGHIALVVDHQRADRHAAPRAARRGRRIVNSVNGKAITPSARLVTAGSAERRRFVLRLPRTVAVTNSSRLQTSLRHSGFATPSNICGHRPMAGRRSRTP